MHAQIRRRATDVVKYYAASGGPDSYGDYIYEEPEDLTCFQEAKLSIVLSESGEEQQSTIRLYFDGLQPFNARKDIFQLLDGDEKYPVLAVSRFRGLRRGTGTTVVYL